MIGIVADSPARYPLFMKISALILAPLLLGPVAAAATPDSASSAETAVQTKAKKRKRRANPKKEAKELELLQRSATLYWEGVRWNDTEKSAEFIENANDRMEFSQSCHCILKGM